MGVLVELNTEVAGSVLRELQEGLDELTGRTDDQMPRVFVGDARVVVGKVAGQPAITLAGQDGRAEVAFTVTAARWGTAVRAFRDVVVRFFKVDDVAF